MITETIEMLRGGDHFGAGELTEIAKGKRQLITTWKQARRRIIRQIQAKKWLKKL